MTNKCDLSIHANEFVPSAPVADTEVVSIHSFDAPQPDPYVQTESQDLLQPELPLISTEEPHIEHETHLLTESIPAEQNVSVEAPIVLVEAAPQSEPKPVIESSIGEPIVVAAAVATATAAMAAAAVSVVKGAPLKKTTDAKKTDVKSKISPIKKPSTTITSKVAAKPSVTAASKTAAPKVASRTVAPKVGTTIEKKTTTSTLTARKPLSNGSKYHINLSISFFILQMFSLINRRVLFSHLFLFFYFFFYF